MYIPPEGKLIRDIESAWTRLEKAEHDRELALREELIRSQLIRLLELICYDFNLIKFHKNLSRVDE